MMGARDRTWQREHSILSGSFLNCPDYKMELKRRDLNPTPGDTKCF
jgi:hypothetical protein